MNTALSNVNDAPQEKPKAFEDILRVIEYPVDGVNNMTYKVKYRTEGHSKIKNVLARSSRIIVIEACYLDCPEEMGRQIEKRLELLLQDIIDCSEFAHSRGKQKNKSQIYIWARYARSQLGNEFLVEMKFVVDKFPPYPFQYALHQEYKEKVFEMTLPQG